MTPRSSLPPVEGGDIRTAEKWVVDAALTWWLNRRPVSFTEADHLANPTINTSTDREKRLAKKVAELRALANEAERA